MMVDGLGDREPVVAEQSGEPVLLAQQRPGVDPGIVDVGVEPALTDADGDRAPAITGFGAEDCELQALPQELEVTEPQLGQLVGKPVTHGGTMAVRGRSRRA